MNKTIWRRCCRRRESTHRYIEFILYANYYIIIIILLFFFFYCHCVIPPYCWGWLPWRQRRHPRTPSDARWCVLWGLCSALDLLLLLGRRTKQRTSDPNATESSGIWDVGVWLLNQASPHTPHKPCHARDEPRGDMQWVKFIEWIRHL